MPGIIIITRAFSNANLSKKSLNARSVPLYAGDRDWYPRGDGTPVRDPASYLHNGGLGGTILPCMQACPHSPADYFRFSPGRPAVTTVVPVVGCR